MKIFINFINYDQVLWTGTTATPDAVYRRSLQRRVTAVVLALTNVKLIVCKKAGCPVDLEGTSGLPKHAHIHASVSQNI